MLAPFSVAVVLLLSTPQANASGRPSLDVQLRTALKAAGFTGTIESQLTDVNHLNRALDASLIGLGSFLFFDPVLSIHEDTSCASCHSPAFGWGDSQSIAIGVQSVRSAAGDLIVGPNRTGPRNLRRSPMTANAAFYPKLMWDGRFSAESGNPFDNTGGFNFPVPEDTMFPGGGAVTHLLAAQAFIPVTEFVEMAGFNGTAGDSDMDTGFAQFDEDLDTAEPPDTGLDVPDPDTSGYRHDPIRDRILKRLNGSSEYVTRFTAVFPAAAGGNIDFEMVAAALAEFQFNQVAADARLDRYARSKNNTLLTDVEKRGALIFFGKGQCVSCHAVAGESSEMFSDFQNHVVAAPQVAPVFGVDTFGVGLGNVIFDGTDREEDYGHERTTGDSADRYMFRTAPLRNLARSPAYFHDGSFTDLGEAIAYHVHTLDSVADYVPPSDLAGDLVLLGPYDEMLNRLDDLLDPDLNPDPYSLTPAEITQLTTFVRDALLDMKSAPLKQCAAKPNHVPSHLDMEKFGGC